MSSSNSNEMYIREELLSQMSKISQELAKKVVRSCGEKYGFDGETAIRELGLESVVRMEVLHKKVSKVVKNKVVIEKGAFALPFNGECNEICCQALRQNNGLYTQCKLMRKGENRYCKSCQQLADQSEDGVPEYGTISQRMSVGIFEYIDPKGRKPVSYTKVMKKYKLTEEQVLAEAGRLNITINPGHLVAPSQETKRGRPASPKEPKEPKGSKGRPKKAKKVLEIEGDEEDLFASLVADATQEEEEIEVVKDTKSAKELEKKQKEEQRLQEKAEKEAKLAAEKAEKEAKLAAEKAEKEAKLAAEKAEKEAKLAAEKAEKEAKLAAKEQEKKQKEEQRLKEKAEKDAKLSAEKAEKEAKLAAEKAEKEAKLAAEKAEKESKLSEKKDVKKKKSPESPKKAVVESEEEEPDVVKKIEFEGKKYLKSKKTGIIYDYTEYVKNGDQVVVGKWNESKNKIDFTETSEESEEEYEE